MFHFVKDSSNKENEDYKITVSYYDVILKYSRSRLDSDLEAAKECTQETFATYFKLAKTHEIHNPRSWLYRAADVFISRYKSNLAKDKQRLFTLPEYEDDNGNIQDTRFVYEEDFDRFLEDRIDIEIYTKRVLSHLRKGEFELYDLHYNQHLSISEIAERKGKSYKSISNKLYRTEEKIASEIKSVLKSYERVIAQKDR